MCSYRKYLSEERDLSFKLESDIFENTNISEIFNELTQQLALKFDINKGVLVVRNLNENSFLAISTWSNGEFLDGLAISLPTEPSLFEQVALDGQIFSDSYAGIFSGNFFEKKLLLDLKSKSYMLHPLKHEGIIIGMLGYSSHEDLAFSVFEEGILLDVTSKFSEIINEKRISNSF